MPSPFLAERRLTSFSFAPKGWARCDVDWAFCDRTLLPISRDAALFDLIGTTYGGDGITAFGSPNLQGAFPLLTLRDVRASDEPFLLALYAGTRAAEFASFGWPAALEGAFMKMPYAAQLADYRRRHPDSRCQVIEVRGRPGGRLWLAQDARRINVLDISLLAELRGHGVGGECLRRVRRRAAAAGLGVALQVVLDNPTRQLYERVASRTWAAAMSDRPWSGHPPRTRPCLRPRLLEENPHEQTRIPGGRHGRRRRGAGPRSADRRRHALRAAGRVADAHAAAARPRRACRRAGLRGLRRRALHGGRRHGRRRGWAGAGVARVASGAATGQFTVVFEPVDATPSPSRADATRVLMHAATGQRLAPHLQHSRHCLAAHFNLLV